MHGKQSTAFLSIIARRLGRGAARFMLASLLLNIFATAALSAASPGLQDALENDFLTGSYIICTPQGLKRITLDENGNPVSGNEGKFEHCVYCLSFHKITIGSLSSEISYPVHDLIADKRLYSHDVSCHADAVLNMAWPPRAPPQI